MCYFLSAGLKSTDSFNLYSLGIEQITTLSDLVDAGYVLNLDDEQEKFEYCKYALSREGFDVDRMIAIRVQISLIPMITMITITLLSTLKT